MPGRITAARVAIVMGPLALLPAVVPAAIQIEFNKPEVSYSATRVMTSDQYTQEFRQKFFYVPEKTRSEMSQEGMAMATITRDDLGVIWTVLQGMYMESSMDDLDSYSQGAPASPDTMQVVEFAELGDDDVDGYDTTKYRVVARDKKGEEMTGFYWVTAERIPVRMEMNFEMDEGPTQVTVRLEDLQVGPQPESLFEVPAGYTRIDRSAMPGMSNQGFGERVKDSAAEGASQGAEDAVKEESRNRVKEGVSKGLKKLFGG